MATNTGASAVAERSTESLWLAALPNQASANRAKSNRPNGSRGDLLPSPRPAADLAVAVRPADGVVSGLPGAVTDLAVSQDGRSLLAAHYGDDAVTVIDIATLAVRSTIPQVAEPYALAASLDRVYVSSGSGVEDSVLAVDTAAGAELAAKAVNVTARGLAVSPAGDVLYVARCGDEYADIAVIDVESGVVTSIARTPDAAVDTVRLSPDGSRLFATLNNEFGSALQVIDTRMHRVLHTIPVSRSIGDIACHRDGRGVFATGWDAHLGGVLTVIDTAAGRVVDTIAVDGMPTQVVVSGSRAYLVDGDAIVVVDVMTRRVLERVDMGRPVSCIAVSRDEGCLYVGDFDGAITAMSVRTALRTAS